MSLKFVDVGREVLVAQTSEIFVVFDVRQKREYIALLVLAPASLCHVVWVSLIFGSSVRFVLAWVGRRGLACGHAEGGSVYADDSANELRWLLAEMAQARRHAVPAGRVAENGFLA